MNNFQKLGLSPDTVAVLEQMGFENPTPVQERAIPLLLAEEPVDFIGLAQTGTGKTAAFGLPLIERIDTDNDATQALVMSPTRELGQQIGKQFLEFAKSNKKLNVEVVYGGAAIVNQIKALKKPTQIVVATPGRLLDLIKRKAVKLDQVKYVVLDEADEMLNMGFQEPIDDILSHTPADRVTWLFSATMPSAIKKITKQYMQNPVEVAINTSQKSNKDITHQYVITKVKNKVPALRRFMDMEAKMRGIMFCRTKRETQEIADNLGNMGYSVEALHGDLSQAQRDAVMKRFKTRSMQLLVATDVAARGIDVNDLTHVFHHTLPDQLESYTHRSGRTGRAGNKGISLAFINPREGKKITELERKISVTFERVEVPSIESLQNTRLKNWAEKLLEQTENKKAQGLLGQINYYFENVSKEELIRLLISRELEQIEGSEGEGNLNETVGGSPEKRDRSKFNNYFINVGSMDGFSRGDLLLLLEDFSNVDKKYYGTIRMLKNRSYFELDKTQDKGFAQRFEGLELEGRAIRVNRDEDAPKSESKGGEKKSRSKFSRNRKKGGDFGKRGNRSGGGRRRR